MVSEKGLARVWRTWKYPFIILFIIYLLVFWRGYIFEVQREEEGESVEGALTPFDVRISPMIAAGSNVYSVTVFNDQAYVINDLTIEFQDITPTPLDDSEESYEDSVGVNSEVSFITNVKTDAQSFDLVLNDQELVPGLTDLNLYVQNPNSTRTWESTGSGNHEEIHLSQNELEEAGYGDYTITVRHVDGYRGVSFVLTSTVSFGSPVLSKSASGPIEPGMTQDFEFALNLVESDILDLRCVVSATIEIPNVEDLQMDMTFDSNWQMLETTEVIPEEHQEIIPWGPVDITGTSGAIFYALTVLFGFMFYLRVRFKGFYSLKVLGRSHCFLALLTSVLVLDHLSIAVQKSWPWTSLGMLFAYAAFTTLWAFSLVSLFDVEVTRMWGRNKWRKVHLILTCLLALLIVLHFGYMGDHLGWIRNM